jgi:hypothetical protein
LLFSYSWLTLSNLTIYLINLNLVHIPQVSMPLIVKIVS